MTLNALYQTHKRQQFKKLQAPRLLEGDVIPLIIYSVSYCLDWHCGHPNVDHFGSFLTHWIHIEPWKWIFCFIQIIFVLINLLTDIWMFNLLSFFMCGGIKGSLLIGWVIWDLFGKNWMIYLKFFCSLLNYLIRGCFWDFLKKFMNENFLTNF